MRTFYVHKLTAELYASIMIWIRHFKLYMNQMWMRYVLTRLTRKKEGLLGREGEGNICPPPRPALCKICSHKRWWKSDANKAIYTFWLPSFSFFLPLLRFTGGCNLVQLSRVMCARMFALLCLRPSTRTTQSPKVNSVLRSRSRPAGQANQSSRILCNTYYNAYVRL